MFNQLLVNLTSSTQFLSVFGKLTEATDGFTKEAQSFAPYILVGGLVIAVFFAMFKGNQGWDYLKSRVGFIIACTIVLASAWDIIQYFMKLFGN